MKKESLSAHAVCGYGHSISWLAAALKSPETENNSYSGCNRKHPAELQKLQQKTRRRVLRRQSASEADKAAALIYRILAASRGNFTAYAEVNPLDTIVGQTDTKFQR